MRRAVAPLPFSSFAAARALLHAAQSARAAGEKTTAEDETTAMTCATWLLVPCWAGPVALRAGAAQLLEGCCWHEVRGWLYSRCKLLLACGAGVFWRAHESLPANA